MAQQVKNPPVVWETWVRSLGLGRSPGERQRLPSPGLWPGEFNGQYRPCGCKEPDMTECLSLSLLSLSYPEHLDEPDGLRLKPSERC